MSKPHSKLEPVAHDPLPALLRLLERAAMVVNLCAALALLAMIWHFACKLAT